MTEALGPNHWVVSRSSFVFGADLGVRMSVVRLSSGRLVLFSPTELDSETKKFIDELGPVSDLVSPTLEHYKHLKSYTHAYPEARIFAPPGLELKRKDLQISHSLAESDRDEWNGEILYQRLMGSTVNETAFLHFQSRSLIVGDLVFNLRPHNLWEKVVYSLNGVSNRLAISRLFRTTIRDETAFKDSLRRILGWNFDQIALCHGDVVRAKGRQLLKDALYF